ncbi:MAG: flagellar filament capping protein FliD [Oscillospiraceae bacterium]|nr:flagellar filament capping protein FliD [Oscillospiraceae bacterium]
MAINSLSASSNGLSGLVSGLDTESMVDALLAGTQSKIDKQNQKKTQLEYKQTMYREIAAKIKSFQTKFFSYSNPDTNLISSALYNSMSATTTSSAYKVTASTSAQGGSFTVSKVTTAKAQKETSAVNATGKLSGTVSAQKLAALQANLESDANALKITVGDNEVAVKLSSLAGKSNSEVEQVLNQAFQAKGVGATAVFLNGKITVSATDSSAAVSVSGNSTALSAVGGTGKKGTGAIELTPTQNQVLPSIDVTVDGVKKSISFNPLTATDADTLAQQLQTNIADAFGGGIMVTATSGKIEFGFDTSTSSNTTRQITLTGGADVMSAIGIQSGISNKLSLTTAISSNNFKTPVVGDLQKFSINGVEFSISADRSLTSVMNEINNSSAGVKVTYSALTDRFSIEAKSTGENANGFTIEQTQGNLMTAMFGAAGSGNVIGKELKKETAGLTAQIADIDAFSYKGGTVNLTINGTQKSLKIDAVTATGAEGAAAFVESLNAAIAKELGVAEGEESPVSFTLTGSSVSLSAMGEYADKVSITDNSLEAIGYTTKPSQSTTLAQLGITEGVSFTLGSGANTQTVTATADMTLEQLTTAINNANKAATGNASAADVATFEPGSAFIKIAGVEIPMTFTDASGKLFGQTTGQIGVTDATALQVVTTGSNAKATINGVEIERATNNFTVDGVSFTLTADSTDTSTVTVSQDTEKVYNALVSFVEDYNTLVNSMNELLDADANYKSYLPLTSAQKEEMSDREIELWEKKSKEGLLRNDSTLTTIMGNLRNTLYTKPEGGNIALYDLGITTSYFGTKDNLSISSKEDLKSKIAENMTDVQKLFTDSEKGLATMLDSAITKATSNSAANLGTLVQMAGSNSADTTSTIYKQIKSIKTTLSKLEDTYESEYDRYWAKFNAMEQIISNMNQQSSWITSQFG